MEGADEVRCVQYLEPSQLPAGESIDCIQRSGRNIPFGNPTAGDRTGDVEFVRVALLRIGVPAEQFQRNRSRRAVARTAGGAASKLLIGMGTDAGDLNDAMAHHRAGRLME